jgi:hypothetical protein
MPSIRKSKKNLSKNKKTHKRNNKRSSRSRKSRSVVRKIKGGGSTQITFKSLDDVYLFFHTNSVLINNDFKFKYPIFVVKDKTDNNLSYYAICKLHNTTTNLDECDKEVYEIKSTEYNPLQVAQILNKTLNMKISDMRFTFID